MYRFSAHKGTADTHSPSLADYAGFAPLTLKQHALCAQTAAPPALSGDLLAADKAADDGAKTAQILPSRQPVEH